MALREELGRIAGLAQTFAGPREKVAGVVAAEPSNGRRVYLCAYGREGADASWLALDEAGEPVTSRALVRETVSIAALCELAEDSAGGGDLDELRSRLVGLRLTENPPGIDQAEEAVLELQRVLGAPPQLATPQRLDDVGAATRRLEQALGEQGTSPFTEAMKSAAPSVQAFTADVEAAYKVELS
jgi:hypothetical protein